VDLKGGDAIGRTGKKEESHFVIGAKIRGRAYPSKELIPPKTLPYLLRG